MTQGTVDRYFAQLEAELTDLPAARRRDLLEELRTHVDDALAANPNANEADVRNVLERLGDPAEIAAEARERFEVHRALPTKTDWAAVLLLPFGALLYFVIGVVGLAGWVLGAVFLVRSHVWSGREKLLGLLVFPGGLLVPLLLLATPTSSCATFSGPSGETTTCTGFSLPAIVGVPLLIVLVVAPIAVSAYLSSKLSKRAAQERA